LELPGVEFINENGAEQVFAFESRRSRGDESQRRRFCETNPIVSVGSEGCFTPPCRIEFTDETGVRGLRDSQHWRKK
jgi:hypothetical protein